MPGHLNEYVRVSNAIYSVLHSSHPQDEPFWIPVDVFESVIGEKWTEKNRRGHCSHFLTEEQSEKLRCHASAVPDNKFHGHDVPLGLKPPEVRE